MGSSGRRLRILSAAALVMAGTIGWGIATTSPAAACTINTHCYGEANGPKSGIDGVSIDITPSCLSIPSGNFVTDELWLTAPGSTTYWVEAGYLQLGANLNVGGIATAGRYGFFGDNRPGGGFHNHVLHTNPALQDTAVEITKNTSSTWWAYFGQYSGESTSNTMSPTEGQWGSETTTASAHSLYLGTYALYETGSSWSSGIPNPQTPAPSSPETFSWVTRYSSYKAGVAC
jgi:hypothetical protein